MSTRMRNIWNPTWYQGHHKTRSYFEGWYFKVVNADGTQAFAFIPGIAMDPAGKQHAFVQVLDGKGHKAAYHSYDATAFHAAHDRFEVHVGDNYFSPGHIRLDVPGMKGELHFEALSPWPSSFLSPGIMGWYSFVPFMQCYHGIVSLHHSIRGELVHEGKKLGFDGGKGYTEKDWGRSFPSSWIWMQCNHFSDPGVSLTASVARIPWLGNAFTGYIAGLWWKGKLLRFTTYTGAKLEHVSINEDTVFYTLRDSKYRLEITAHQAKGTDLRSPLQGVMEGRVNESMDARIEMKLFELGKTPRLLLEDRGQHAGLEVAGMVEELLLF
ncbi:MAG: hypothetical protein EAZ89_15875 [Bacteroidetes bacterium]|nr:MAG: hypothetical protein EAZ89_15875 [Bacteroidota bacterium]